jgi:hypothetical protein
VVGLVLEVDADELLRAADDTQLDDRVELRVLAEQRRDTLALEQLAQRCAGSSLPTTVSSVACADSVFTFIATLAAPPRRSSSRFTRTTGTGASGEMRSTAPNQ